MKVFTPYPGKNATVGSYSYFYERVKNDMNGNSRYNITVLYKNIALSRVATTYSAFISDLADRIITDYYIKNMGDLKNDKK